VLCLPVAGVRVDTFEREGKKASNVTITYRFAEPSTSTANCAGTDCEPQSA